MSMSVSCDVPGCTTSAPANMVEYEGGQLPRDWHSLDEDRCACPSHEAEFVDILRGISSLQEALQNVDRGEPFGNELRGAYEHLRSGGVIAWECTIPGCETRAFGKSGEPPEAWTRLGGRRGGSGCEEHARVVEMLNGIEDLVNALWILCNEPRPVRKTRCCQQRDETRNHAISHWLPRATEHLRRAAA